MVAHLNITSDLSVSYVGPPIGAPLPALFYFALSADESLSLDPFDQPVHSLDLGQLRVFSITLPGHGPQLDPTKALVYWAEQIEKEENLLEEFLGKVERAVDFLIRKEIILPEKMAIAGLSRGAFIATHVAARLPLFRILLGFAPLTKLSYAKEFQETPLHSLAEPLDLIHLIPSLIHCKVRFYIGNHDMRVGTAHCFHFIEALSKAAFEKRIRSPQVELFIGPSIGYQGHGTSPHTFHEGSRWISEQLGIER